MKASKILGFLLAIALGIINANAVYAQEGNPPVDPGKGTFCPNFIDEDGDGINDNMHQMRQGKAWQNGGTGHGQGMHGQNGSGNRGTGLGMGNQAGQGQNGMGNHGQGMGQGNNGTCPVDGSGNQNAPGGGMGSGSGNQGNGMRHGGRR